MTTPAVAWFEVSGKDGASLQDFYGAQTIVPPTELEHFGLTFALFADPEGTHRGTLKGGAPVIAPETTVALSGPDDASIGLELPAISDEDMRSRLARADRYTLLILKKTPRYRRPAADSVVWEHGRRNMALQRLGLMPMICPARDNSDRAQPHEG
jgi:hypothetical protein